MNAIPPTPYQIDRDWLGDVVGGRVDGIEVEAITDRRGVNGETYRLHLRGLGVPTSVVAKFPGEASRGVARFQRWYEREVRFYRELAAETPLASPRCFAAEIDEADHFLLILEDLSSLPQGDQVTGCTPTEAERIVRSLAAMHARWWGRAPDWLPLTTVGLDRAHPVQAAFARSWAAARPLVPVGAHAAIDAAVEGYVALLESIATGPVTLCHGDFRLDNLFLPGTGADPVVGFDWQFACRARGTYDLAYFLGLDLEPEHLATHESALIDVYVDALRAHGIDDYDADTARHDYDVALLLSAAVFSIGAASTQLSVASRRMHEVGLLRLGSAIARIGEDHTPVR